MLNIELLPFAGEGEHGVKNGGPLGGLAAAPAPTVIGYDVTVTGKQEAYL